MLFVYLLDLGWRELHISPVKRRACLDTDIQHTHTQTRQRKRRSSYLVELKHQEVDGQKAGDEEKCVDAACVYYMCVDIGALRCQLMGKYRKI